MKMPPATTAQEWFLMNERQLIVCPNHPGDLKITLSACRLRRRKALEWEYGAPLENLFVCGWERHLLVCRDCRRVPLGKAHLTLVEAGLKTGSKFIGHFLKRKSGKNRAVPPPGERPADFPGGFCPLHARREKSVRNGSDPGAGKALGPVAVLSSRLR